MRRMLLKWWYGRKFLKACKLLKQQYHRHRDAGHEVYLTATGEPNVSFVCVNCTERQPLRRKPEHVEQITRDKFGHPYTR